MEIAYLEVVTIGVFVNTQTQEECKATGQIIRVQIVIKGVVTSIVVIMHLRMV